jgi:hypothetical protein
MRCARGVGGDRLCNYRYPRLDHRFGLFPVMRLMSRVDYLMCIAVISSDVLPLACPAADGFPITRRVLLNSDLSPIELSDKFLRVKLADHIFDKSARVSPHALHWGK